MEYPVTSSVTKNFKNEAVNRGYSRRQTREYVKERTDLYKSIAPKNDLICLATVLGTLGAIAKKCAGTKTKFGRAATVQFKPFFKEVKKVVMSPNDSLFKSFINGAELAYRAMKGTCKSIPKVVAIPALTLLAINTVKYHTESAKIDAKHDTLKYLRDRHCR